MSLVETRLQDFRANNPALDKWETRAGRWGYNELYRRQTNAANSIVNEDMVAKALASVGSNLTVPVFDFDDSVQVLEQTIPVAVGDSPNTSSIVPVTFRHFYWSFHIYPSRHLNNEKSMQADFELKMRKHIFAYLNLKDQLSGAHLEIEKTAVLLDDLGGRYPITANIVEAGPAEHINIIGDLNPLNAGNAFFDQLEIVGNGSLESHLRTKLLPNGDFNSENQNFQWNDKVFSFTNNLTNAAGHSATGFAVQPGTVGWLDQFAPDCLLGQQTSKHQWSIENLPIANEPIGAYFYDDAADISSMDASTSHMTSTKVQAYAFHKAVAFIGPHITGRTTRPTPVMKFALATS
jgi:hypothetical protein